MINPEVDRSPDLHRPKARITCTACYTITCREYRDEIGIRHVEGIDGSRVDDFDGQVFDCPVLRDEKKEDYILWLLEWNLLREILKEESSGL